MINRRYFILLIFLSAVGLCTGSFFEVFMEGDGKIQLMDLLSSFFQESNHKSFYTLFASSAKSWFIIWGFLLLCPILPPLAILCPLLCVIKGLSVGFSATMLIETFGIKGCWYILISILPQNIIQIPTLCLLSTLSASMAIIVFKLYVQKRNRKKNKNALQMYAKHYIVINVFALALILVSCLIEAFLKQFLL